MTNEQLSEIRTGLETAYINGNIASNLSYQPQFVSNNYKDGKKVLSSIEDEKSDAETGFYYVGQFDVSDVRPDKKKDNSGKYRDITKFQMKMHYPVREDLFRYLQSSVTI